MQAPHTEMPILLTSPGGRRLGDGVSNSDGLFLNVRRRPRWPSIVIIIYGFRLACLKCYERMPPGRFSALAHRAARPELCMLADAGVA